MSATPDTPELPDARPPRGRAGGLATLTSHSLRSLPFVALLVTLLGAGMVGQLALNVAIQDQQLRLNKAQASAASLALEVSDKQARVYAAGAPGQLASEAAKLGMVPNTYPGFIDLRTGAIVGSPKPVTGREMPALATGRPAAPVVPAPPGASASPGVPAPTTPAPAASPSAAASPTPKASAKPTPTPSATKPAAKKTAATPTPAKPSPSGTKR